MAGDMEQSFVESYGDRLIRLAEKELDSLPVCNNGTYSREFKFLQNRNFYYFLFPEFLRLLLVCILVMPEIKKIRKNSTDEKIQQLVIFVSVCNKLFYQLTVKELHNFFYLIRRIAIYKN